MLMLWYTESSDGVASGKTDATRTRMYFISTEVLPAVTYPSARHTKRVLRITDPPQPYFRGANGGGKAIAHDRSNCGSSAGRPRKPTSNNFQQLKRFVAVVCTMRPPLHNLPAKASVSSS